MPAPECIATSLCHSLVRHTNMQHFIPAILLIVFLLYAVLLLYYRAAWRSIPSYQEKEGAVKEIVQKQPAIFISVLIPARNEEKELPELLASLGAQTYPAHLFEILVIDDHSTDQTAAIVKDYPLSNIRLITLKDQPGFLPVNSYKKWAIQTGVTQSRGELIVTTDADCIMPARWLETIAAFYAEKKPVFIAMPVAINCGNRFIEIFQALDFMTLQGITGAAVHQNMHSMCNGANLAYTKAAFEEVSGFEGIDHIASGDDMLLMHKIYRQHPAAVLYLKSRDVIVQTAPVAGVKAFFNQRIRWASKAGHYHDKSILSVLVLVYFINLLLLIIPVIAAIKNREYSLAGFRYSLITIWFCLLLLKTAAELFFLFPVAVFFLKKTVF